MIFKGFFLLLPSLNLPNCNGSFPIPFAARFLSPPAPPAGPTRTAKGLQFHAHPKSYLVRRLRNKSHGHATESDAAQSILGFFKGPNHGGSHQLLTVPFKFAEADDDEEIDPGDSE